MQPILDTAPTNITKEPRMGLNPAIGNRRERGRCPRYWGIVLGLSERAIYARRPPKGIDEGSNDLEGDRGGSKDREGDRGGSKVHEGPRRSSRVVEGSSEVLGRSVRVRTSLARVVEVGDECGSADEGPEALWNSVGMTGHVVPLHHPPSRSQRPRCIGLCQNEEWY